MTPHIGRHSLLTEIEKNFRAHPAVAITGARQAGKTTLAREFARTFATVAHFDLESSRDLRRLEQPEMVLGSLQGLVVIDEIQRKPELFETLRYLIDRPESKASFLLLGSASPDLIRGVSESLAGRIGVVDLGGFNLREIGAENWQRLWLHGGFPRSYLADDQESSVLWRRSFVRTFLERDIPQFGINLPTERLRRFWTMIAHYHGQVWNGAEFARALGTSEPTARNYLDILAGAYMVRLVPAWFENLKKRQVKAPKIYIRDSGLLHSLLGLESLDELLGHPKLGASWEGFALEQILSICSAQSGQAYFWGTHGGAELDLMLQFGGERFGFEFKRNDAPGTTRSMRVALEDLNLKHLWIVYPGDQEYQLDERITAMPITGLLPLLEKIKR